MNNKNFTYLNHYLQDFKQRPVVSSFILILQIFFLWAWGLYFYLLIKDFTTIVIPGQTECKDNIYLYTFENVVSLVIGGYIFYRTLPLMFAANKNFKKYIVAYALSFAMLLLWIAIGNFTYSFYGMSKENPIAFWAAEDTTPL